MATTWSSRPDPGTPLDGTLRRLVVAFRSLGWAWMMLLVVLTLVSDDDANTVVVVSTAVVATVATVAMIPMSRHRTAFGSYWYVTLDGLVVLWIGAASTVSGAENLFHGGFLISWIMLAAYVRGRMGALIAATVLTIEQVAVHLIDSRGLVPTAGSVIFFIFALIVGWTVDALRESDTTRTEALNALEAERTQSALRDERVRLADQIHDTVLQSLHAIRLHAEEPNQVRYLARRQERDLRRAVAELQSPHDSGFRVALLCARDDVEDMYGVEIDAVIRHDAHLDDALTTVVEGTREAMLNAALHSGSPRIEVYSERADDAFTVTVKDHGTGFDTSRVTPHRGIGRCADRIGSFGGSLTITSTDSQGTECTIRLPQT